jgi:hypothetical protein
MDNTPLGEVAADSTPALCRVILPPLHSSAATRCRHEPQQRDGVIMSSSNILARDTRVGGYRTFPGDAVCVRDAKDNTSTPCMAQRTLPRQLVAAKVRGRRSRRVHPRRWRLWQSCWADAAQRPPAAGGSYRVPRPREEWHRVCCGRAIDHPTGHNTRRDARPNGHDRSKTSGNAAKAQHCRRNVWPKVLPKHISSSN